MKTTVVRIKMFVFELYIFIAEGTDAGLKFPNIHKPFSYTFNSLPHLKSLVFTW
jgi:hypothetical protein